MFGRLHGDERAELRVGEAALTFQQIGRRRHRVVDVVVAETSRR